MSFSGVNAAEAAQLGSAMRTELEWISRTSGYAIKQSTSTLRTPPAMNRLSSADRAQNPKYLINGVITSEGGVSVADISLWNLEGPALLFSQAFEYRRLDDALSMTPFFTWSLYAILPVLETPAEELNAAKAEAKAARAEASTARADARNARLETASARSEADAARAEAEAARAEAASAKAEAEAAKAALENGDSADNAVIKAWKSRWVYLGLRGGISPRFYIFEADFPKELGFTWEAALQAEFQFLRFPWGRRTVFLALQGEGILTVDRFNLADADGNPLEMGFFSIMTPLLLKLNYKPGPFSLSLYGGMYYIWYLPADSAAGETIKAVVGKGENASFLDSLGYSAGFKFGVKAGKRGTIFFDLRYSSDIGVTEIEGGSPMSYRRYIPSISLGYELGLFNRK